MPWHFNIENRSAQITQSADVYSRVRKKRGVGLRRRARSRDEGRGGYLRTQYIRTLRRDDTFIEKDPAIFVSRGSARGGPRSVAGLRDRWIDRERPSDSSIARR